MEGRNGKNNGEDIVIVGGGICGLATALALHRKGMRSRVMESSSELRAAGAAIIMQENGWKALEELGVASKLRPLSPTSLQSGEVVNLNDGKREPLPSWGELRVIRRSDLIKALAEELPEDTIWLGCKVVGVEFDPTTSYPQLHLHDGSVINAKVVVGCDGVKSVVARTALGFDSTAVMSVCVTRGFADFEDGHSFGDRFYVDRDLDAGSQLGHFPVSDNLVYWFLVRPTTSKDPVVSKDQKLIKETCLDTVKAYPPQSQATVKNSDERSLHLTELRYRRPWDVLTTNFRTGTVTVAGDAMHAMGPFLAQGGAASLEDAVVLANCLSARTTHGSGPIGPAEMGPAIDEYVSLRRMRVFWLSLDTYLIGRIVTTPPSFIRFCCVLLKMVLFRDPVGHIRYDCRRP